MKLSPLSRSIPVKGRVSIPNTLSRLGLIIGAIGVGMWGVQDNVQPDQVDPAAEVVDQEVIAYPCLNLEGDTSLRGGESNWESIGLSASGTPLLTLSIIGAAEAAEVLIHVEAILGSSATPVLEQSHSFIAGEFVVVDVDFLPAVSLLGAQVGDEVRVRTRVDWQFISPTDPNQVAEYLPDRWVQDDGLGNWALLSEEDLWPADVGIAGGPDALAAQTTVEEGQETVLLRRGDAPPSFTTDPPEAWSNGDDSDE